MFDSDEFVSECRKAVTGPDPLLAIRELLEAAVAQPQQLLRAFPIDRAEIIPLFTSAELSILKVVWAPGMRFRPHNHLMWAAIALYSGQENNVFYRRRAGSLIAAGGRELGTGDVAILGADVIHAVENPTRLYTGALHVYGGDIARRPGRSEWEEPALTEITYDFARARRYFDALNAGD